MTVRVYRSTDYNAPTLSGQVGSLIGVLTACLVNGYGNNALTSLTQTGGVATATCTSPHGITVGTTAKRVISGANEAGYNIEATVTSTGASTFTYAVDSGTAASATGSPSVRCGGSGWTVAHGPTANVIAYRQPTSGANGFYLRVDDNTVANIARIAGYETMSDVNTGGNTFPTSAQLNGGAYVYKSASTDTVARSWKLVCNGKIFYLSINHSSAADWSSAQMTAFGDISSYKSGDTFHTALIGASTNAATNLNFGTVSTASPLTSQVPGHFMARSYSGSGTSILLGKLTDSIKANNASMLGGSGLGYPHPVDGGIYVAPVWVNETVLGVLRGELPGLWNPLHDKPLVDGDIWTPTGDLSGKKLEAFTYYSSGQVFIEISDTW